MGTTNGTTLYVVLPRYDDDQPEIFTGPHPGAPYADLDAITIAATHTIALAKQAEPNETACGECGLTVGYCLESHHDDPDDPDNLVIDGFHVTPTGAILCGRCANPATTGPLWATATENPR